MDLRKPQSAVPPDVRLFDSVLTGCGHRRSFNTVTTVTQPSALAHLHQPSLRVLRVSGARRSVDRLRDMAKWVVLHLSTDEASTYINVDAVTQVRQVASGSTRISFSDGTDVSVREDAPIVIAAFRRDSI